MHTPKPGWLDEIFPYEQKFVTVNGRRMAYVDEGDKAAPPVLLLSGNPTWSFLYRDFFPVLTQAGYRALAPDWVGAGYSDHPFLLAQLTTAHHVADLVSLMDQLGLRQITIVGQDWGGPQGLGAALTRVERMAALALMNTFSLSQHNGEFHSSLFPWQTWNAPLTGPFFHQIGKALAHAGPSAVSRRGMSPAEARAYHHVFDEPGSEAGVLAWPRNIPWAKGGRGWEDMRAIERRVAELAHLPTLLMWAPEDEVFGLDYAQRLGELMPWAEGPATFDNAAHFLQDDRGPDLARTLADFLAKHQIGGRP